MFKEIFRLGRRKRGGVPGWDTINKFPPESNCLLLVVPMGTTPQALSDKIDEYPENCPRTKQLRLKERGGIGAAYVVPSALMDDKGLMAALSKGENPYPDKIKKVV